MRQTLTLLHSSEVHCETFDTLRDAIAPTARLDHQVRTDWLARARKDGMTHQLSSEIHKAVQSAPGPVLCTCTTLGEAAQAAGAVRVDQPMMERAAQSAGPILLICTLESTVESSRSLLEQHLKARMSDTKVTVLVLEQFWPIFEAGQMTNFCAAIAAAAIEALNARPDFATVVLAQVSMAGAADLLQGCGADVLSSPDLALRSALDAKA